jgi:hypothetical protein
VAKTLVNVDKVILRLARLLEVVEICPPAAIRRGHLRTECASCRRCAALNPPIWKRIRPGMFACLVVQIGSFYGSRATG